MSERTQGSAWVFGDDVTTDDILPGAYLHYGNHEVGRYAMAGIDPELAGRIEPGDFVVGGANFGSGSGRESAPYALQGAGVAAVIATSMARVFFRNCINIGLAPVIVDSVEGIESGDRLTLDLTGRSLTCARTGVSYLVRNLTGISLEILQAGGIVPYTKARMAARDSRSRNEP